MADNNDNEDLNGLTEEEIEKMYEELIDSDDTFIATKVWGGGNR